MPTFEDFVLRLMKDPSFASDLLSPTSTAAKRTADFAGMSYSPGAIAAAEAVFGSLNFQANMQTLIAEMSLAPGGVAAAAALTGAASTNLRN